MAELEDLTLDLFTKLFRAMPKQWIEAAAEMREGKRSDISDPVGRLWVTAFVFAKNAIDVFEHLGDAMRQKARIDGPGPWREACGFWLEDDEGDAAELGETELVADGGIEKGES